VIIPSRNPDFKGYTFTYPRCEQIIQKGYTNVAKADNDGVRKAKGEYIFRVVDDLILPTNILEKLLYAYKTLSKIYKVGAIVVPTNPQTDLVTCNYFDTNSISRFGMFKNFDFVETNTFGAGMFFRKQDYLKFKMDEILGFTFIDVDMAYRMFKEGYHHFFLPIEPVKHKKHSRRARSELHFRNYAKICKRYMRHPLFHFYGTLLLMPYYILKHRNLKLPFIFVKEFLLE